VEHLCLGCGECVLLFQSLCAADMITPALLVVCIRVRSRMDWDAAPRVLLLGPFRHVPLMSLQRYGRNEHPPNFSRKKVTFPQNSLLRSTVYAKKKMLRRRQASRLARALIAAQQPFSFSFLLFSFYFSFCATFPFLFLFVFFSFVFVTCIANDANALNALQNVADDANEKTTTKKVKI
jgi:hypothetical protein